MGKRIIAAVLGVFLLCGGASGYSDEDLLFLDLPVMIASKTAMSVYESPGIISLMNRQDIEALGARNMSDIFAHVPGFQQAYEVYNLSSFGIRGMYAIEGKLLMMVDGLQINDTLYGNPLFSSMFFADFIDKIEVIRGPGSAIYGGFGELGVVNFTSRGASMKGGYAAVTYGQMPKTFGERIAAMGYGNTVEGVSFYVNAAAGDGNISDEEYKAMDGTGKDMGAFGGQRAWMATAGAEAFGLSIKYAGGYYDVESVISGYLVDSDEDETYDGFEPTGDEPLLTKFQSHMMEIKYTLKPYDKLELSPFVNYTNHRTWINDDETAETYGYTYIFPSWKMRAGLGATYDIAQGYSISLGGEYAHDETVSEGEISPAFSDGSRLKTYNSQSVYAELTAKTDWVNVIAGARYDNHSVFGGVLVPRIALTKDFGNFYAKGLASYAYRAPTTLNIDYNPDIKPEYLTDFQFQAGYKAGGLHANLTVFDTRIKDIITYYEEDIYTFGYENSGRLGTYGCEAEIKYSDKWGSASLSYSLSRASENESEYYSAYDAGGELVGHAVFGMAEHKAAASGEYKVTDWMSVNPSLLFLGNRFTTYYRIDTGALTEEYINEELAPVAVTNLVLRFGPFEGLSFDLACYNVFDSVYSISQGYVNYQSPVHEKRRELLVKMSYKF